jgi:phospholipase C
MMNNRLITLCISIVVILSLILSGTFASVKAASSAAASEASPTRTPIKNLVVIFQENVSFDHYFGTYPNATNPTRT